MRYPFQDTGYNDPGAQACYKWNGFFFHDQQDEKAAQYGKEDDPVHRIHIKKKSHFEQVDHIGIADALAAGTEKKEGRDAVKKGKRMKGYGKKKEKSG